MQSLPFWIFIGAMVLWSLSALVFSSRGRGVVAAPIMFFSVIQLFAAIWGATLLFSHDVTVGIGHTWVTISQIREIAIGIELNAMSAVLWVLISTAATFFAFVNLFGNTNDSSATLRQLTIFPLMAVAVWMTICSSNIVTFYVGWMSSAAIGYLSLVVDSAEKHEWAVAAKKQLVMNIISGIIFSVGLIGLYYDHQTFVFSEIASKGSETKVGFIFVLLFATLLRGMQLPFKELSKYTGVSGYSVVTTSVVSQLFVAPLIFLKLYPQLINSYDVHNLAIVPAITGLIAALDLISEKEISQKISGLSVVVSSYALMFGLLGNFQACMAVLVSGFVTVLFFAWAMLFLGSMRGLGKYLFAFAALSLSGAPWSSWGWAQFLNYTGLLTLNTGFAGLGWVLLFIKFISDVLLGLFVWKEFWFNWISTEDDKVSSKEVFVGLVIFALTTFSISVGGRPFGGLFGESGLEVFSGWCWFERLFSLPSGSQFLQKPAADFLGTNEDVFARGISFSVFLITTLISGLWLFRDLAGISEFTETAGKVSSSVRGPLGRQRSVIWDFVFEPISKVLSKVANAVEERVLGNSVEWFCGVFKSKSKVIVDFIDNKVIDSVMVDGFSRLASYGNKVVRTVHNGRVQFYTGLGLILFMILICRFIFIGG